MPSFEHDEPIDAELNWLMDHYGDAVYRFLLTLLRDPDAAMDCAQETFVRAYGNLRRGKPVNAAWLYTVARSRAVDELQHRRREQPELERLEGLPANETEPTPRAGRIRRALDALSSEDRELLYLFSVDRFKTDEIATMLGIEPGAVRMRLTRARKRFRLAYGGEM